MTTQNISQELNFKILSDNSEDSRNVSGVFCCDLLSLAMSKLPAGSVWVTVMGNVNTLAVASLTEAACIIVAENIQPDDNTIKKAQEQNIMVMKSPYPIFETADMVNKLINA